MNYSHTPWSNLFNLLPKYVVKGELSSELDHDFYRLVHEDTRNWTNEEVESHFQHHGSREGRLASPAAQRLGFLAMVPDNLSILEIGPFTKPAFTGQNVKFFDVLSRDELLERARKVGYPTNFCPDIDFLSPEGDLSIVPTGLFDIVFSSHCIEHQPDLISHLLQVERILKPEGRYFLIIPDKRYCFDYFLPPSDIDEILRAHSELRKVHTMKSIYEHYVLTTHSNTLEHWCGRHDDPNFADRADRAHHAVETFHSANGSYVDVHAWQFTPESFREVINTLNVMKKIDLSVERVYQTVWGQNEFTAVVKKSA